MGVLRFTLNKCLLGNIHPPAIEVMIECRGSSYGQIMQIDNWADKRLLSFRSVRITNLNNRSSRGRVVKALDLKSNGVSPRRFESCRLRQSFFNMLISPTFPLYWKPKKRCVSRGGGAPCNPSVWEAGFCGWFEGRITASSLFMPNWRPRQALRPYGRPRGAGGVQVA